MPTSNLGEVGVEPFTVVAGLLERDGKIFLVKRPRSKKDGGKWEFPGGKVEVGESLLEALRRELKEELGIELVEAEEFLVTRGTSGGVNFTLHLFTVKSYRGEIRTLEAEEANFFEPSLAFTLPLCEPDLWLLKQITLNR